MFCRKDPFEDKVKCEECKHWIDKSDAQEVANLRLVHFWPGSRTSSYYCPLHKKPYEKILSPGIYTKKMLVDENGTPIGYKKIKTKKHD